MTPIPHHGFMAKRSPKKRAVSKAIVAATPLVMSTEEPDERLVDQAVEDLQAILAETVSRGMEQIGTYLLDAFYSGSPDAYLSTTPSKHASLNLLMQRCETLELPIRRTALSNALRVAAFSRSLPKGAQFNKLPPSHRVELVRVGDPERVEAIAARAVDEDLSVAKVRELVREEQPKPKTGRPRTPPALKMLDACVRQLTNTETRRLALKKSDVKEMDDEDRAEARARLDTLKRRIEAMEKLLG